MCCSSSTSWTSGEPSSRSSSSSSGWTADRYVPMVVCFRPGRVSAEIEAAGVPVFTLRKRAKLDLRLVAGLWRSCAGSASTRPDVPLHGEHLGEAGGDHRPRPVIVSSERNVDMWEERFKPTIGRWLDRLTYRTTGNSQAVKDYLVKKGLAPDKVDVIYNGVDPRALRTRAGHAGRDEVGARHPSASLGGRPPRPSRTAEGPPDTSCAPRPSSRRSSRPCRSS